MAKDKKSPNAAKTVVQEMLPSADLWTSERRHKEDVGSMDASRRSERCHPDDVDTAPSMRADPPATAKGGALGQPGKSDASAPPSNAEPGGKAGTVNDCKEEVCISKTDLSCLLPAGAPTAAETGGPVSHGQSVAPDDLAEGAPDHSDGDERRSYVLIAKDYHP